MGATTEIQWTDLTWNVARGCRKVDKDCLHCYMYRDSLNETRYNPKEIAQTKTVFNLPLRYKETKSKVWHGKPLVFTSSLTDVFLEELDSYRNEMWDIIRRCPHLIFQILTKRPERIKQCLPPFWHEIKNNVWLGTSVGHKEASYRIAELVVLTTQVPVGTIFLSLEPLQESLHIKPELLRPFDWVIVGGESGNENGKYRYRECRMEWIENILLDCANSNVPVFVKQLGTYLSKELGLKHRHGGEMEEWPAHLRVRDFPKTF